MMTNTYKPHVGGVARSVEAFTAEYRSRGHHVVVVAPKFENTPAVEEDVVRLFAIQHFKGSDFSVRIPIPGRLSSVLKEFQPDIVHSHHPFMLGDTALRVAHQFEVPIVFTHHTMYEQYMHYVPGDSPALRRFVVKLSTGYANLCDQVFAPSESVCSLLQKRGVESPISVVPTGVDLKQFKKGSGHGFRLIMDIPRDAFVVGHLGRLAPEKNLEFLTEAVVSFLKKNSQARFLLVGRGSFEKNIKHIITREGLAHRMCYLEVVEGPLLVSAYRAMNVFVFASKSETQGMVLTEAMAAGVPVVALDAPGAREVVRDRENACLLASENKEDFVSALGWVASASPQERQALRRAALKTADRFSMKRCTDRALTLYESLREKKPVNQRIRNSLWASALTLIKTEWDLMANVAEAAGSAVTNEGVVDA